MLNPVELALPLAMAEKKAPYPGAPPQPPQGFVQGPSHAAYGVPTSSPYGVFPTQAQLYAAAAAAQAQAQGPPPTYDQTLNHHMVGQQMYPPGAAAAAAAAAAQMYAAQGYPGYLGYPNPYNPMQAAYYPSLAAYAYPGMPPAAAQQFRPTIMVPGAYDPGARFDGIAQQVIPQSPPGVAPNAAQLAAMAGHGVALSQKKGSYLAGGSEGGYTFW
ncbi:hypothetical protein FOCC_FOCC002581 [Frankliniella occidentalis]|nr:hypothetical protein FOCC_FOCC002581 [Frankliniella occidentalis]